MKAMRQNISTGCLVILLAFSAGTTFGATDTWSGNGADAYWGTSGNWTGGNATPAANDALVFGSANQQNNTNNISSLTAASLAFTAGGFTLNGTGGLLALNGPLTNRAGINTLALGLNVTVQNAGWNLASGTELRIAGTLTNSTTANPLATMGGGGTLRITSTNFTENRFFTLTNGTIVIDGGVVSTLDGFRLQPGTGYTAAFQLTNNGSLTIGVGGNLRLGQTATGGTSRVDMSSGTLNLNINTGPGAGDIFVGEAANTTVVFNQNGGLVEFTGNGDNRVAFANASAAANGTYNLNGGTLWPAQIAQINPGSPGGTFNFNGGVLKALTNSATFFQGVQNANVQNGGAIIDTTNWNITIGQNLQAAGTGGLTKLGTGTLTLSGANTYTGPTVVSNGTLVTSYSSFQGNGAITVAGTGNLSVAYVGAAISASALNLGSAGTSTLSIDFGSSAYPGGSPLFTVNSLNGTGTALINITGSGFTPGSYPLIAYSSASGLGSIRLGTLPLGLSGSLVASGNVLSLNVALVPKNLEWAGTQSANWDTSTHNWFDVNNGGTLTNYAQSGGNGDAVTFDDSGSANPNVNLGITVTPSQVIFNNNSIPMAISGSGKISGGVGVVLNGYQPVTLGTANDYTGGTTLNGGILYLGANQALGSGPATLNAGTLASDGATARTISGPVVQNGATGVTLGDSVNTGPLTLAGGLNLGGLGATLDFNSDVIVSGMLTNGGIATKSGPGALIVEGPGRITTQATETMGNTIINGGQLVQAGDGWRMEAATPGTSMDFTVTNGGSFIMTNLVTANFRLGLAGEDSSATYTLDVAGQMVVYAAGNPATAGRVYVGLGSTKATVNLWPGGDLICGQLTSGGACPSEVDFYGGTLTPTFSSTTFFQGVTNALVHDGGAVVDTTNLSITIAQPLLAAGSGGLTKLGAGTLTLAGTNTYTGATLVNAGKLALAPGAGAPGGVVVNANATLAFMQPSAAGTVSVPSVTIGSGTNSALEADLVGTTAPAGTIANLILNGPAAVNVSGPLIVGEFPLFGYGTISGPGGLTLGQIPQGTVAYLVTNTNAKTIDVVVSFITQSVWTGATNSNWDTVTTNWTSAGVPVAYAQLASVLFNDTASNSTVNLTGTLSPSSMVISNNALSYQFAGAGNIGGNMNLTKLGTNSASLGTANTFSGSLSIKGGVLLMSNSAALGSSANPVYVTNSGTLDIDGNSPALEPVIASGAGANGIGALINSGPDQNNAFRSVTLTGDTTVGGTGLIGIRTTADSDPGLAANGYNLTKVGTDNFNLNGGTTVAGLTNEWDTDIGNIDIKQGGISFERRSALGRTNNTITVEAGALIQLYSLNQTLPAPINRVVMTNATFQGTGATAGDVNTFDGPLLLNGNSNFVNTAASTYLSLNGPIAGPGGAVFNGAITLGGINTFTGPTVVSNSTLTLAYGGTLSGTPNITVLSNATLDVSAIAPWTLGAGQTLGGYGTINGSVVANGTVAPGAAMGTLTFNNALTLAGTTVMVLDKDVAGQTNDVIAVNNDVLTYGGALTVVAAGSTPLVAGDSFRLFSFSSNPAGSFSATNLPAGYAWDTSQLATAGTIKVTGIASRPHPRFTTVTVSAGSVILSGTNAAGSYTLYSTTNLASPNWIAVFTNTFSGSFSFTNSIDVPQKFYLLK